MWKFSCLIVVMVFFCTLMKAQNSYTDGSETTESKWGLIRTHQSDIFRFKDTARWALRWSASPLSSPQIQSKFNLAHFDFTFEFLPLRNWSIGISSRFQSSFSNYSNYDPASGLKFGVELRNYIRKEDHSPNMNGLYWALRGESGRERILIDQSIKYLGYNLTGRMGFQTLLSKTFFIDLNVGIGATYTALDQYTSTMQENNAIQVVTTLGWKPIIDPQLKLGWAISRPRSTTNNKDLWLRGQSTKTIQYKIDLFGLFNHNLSGLSTTIELEKAFNKSGFSINLGAAGELHRPDHITGADQDQLYVEQYTNQSWRVYAEPRWYYNVRKRLRNNLTNNVFSGNFLSLLVGHQQIYYKSDFEHKPYVQLREQKSLSGVELCWGVQRSFFDVAFAECRLGVSSMVEKNSFADGLNAHTINAFDAVADIKIGLKF